MDTHCQERVDVGIPTERSPLLHLSQAAAAAAEVEAAIDSRFIADRVTTMVHSSLPKTECVYEIVKGSEVPMLELKIDETSMHPHPYISVSDPLQ
jgi:hypothetical protein